MANAESVAKLKEGHGPWRQWRDGKRAGSPELDLSNALLIGEDLTGFPLAIVDLTGANLRTSILRGADLEHANLSKALFGEAHLEGARLSGAVLDGADLEGAHVDTLTTLRDASVVDCKIEKRTLIRMPNYGGLTAGQMMDMKVVDPVAKLRSYYSGVWQWIHLAALSIFLWPYVVFVGRKYLAARVGDILAADGNGIPLWRALTDFIWTGGTNEFAPWTFVAFCFSVLYNLLRASLLFKTKNLELEQQASGLPARFSLAGGWGRALKLANWLFFANLLLVLIHSIHFLQIKVPR